MQPMIKVEDLTKRYAGVTALNGVSFEVQRGEIVGFLGPNGAGKSTTMRILTGFIPASAGRAQVAGLDVFENSLEVRERVGYMPENNPLYTDMRVSEYLKFRAKLKKLPRAERAERIPEVMELTGIKDVSHRIIGQLSKGYRQRVGLADALLAEPDLLILDEPTIGLDPVQIRQVRQLIKDLGKRHTILLSTHILPEVEMTCNRVIIIHHGRILASDAPENLTKTLNAGGLIEVEIRGPGSEVQAKLRAVDGVESVQAKQLEDGWVRVTLTPKPGVDPREKIYQAVVSNGWTLRELMRSRTTLEDIFVQITREEDEAEEERREQRRSVRR
ncbi:MAG TPA: ATP-binding cassette domain-containing protein [Verrucomicrobiae bacterium]|nr:ATP-binding cassette domain-containing protein [Verrucomicrobiae bacterium]